MCISSYRLDHIIFEFYVKNYEVNVNIKQQANIFSHSHSGTHQTLHIITQTYTSKSHTHSIKFISVILLTILTMHFIDMSPWGTLPPNDIQPITRECENAFKYLSQIFRDDSPLSEVGWDSISA